jgi:hypothetical protein
MTCYACGRQPGDVCRNEDGCTAHDAPVHSSQPLKPQPQKNRAAGEKPKPGPASAWPFPRRVR